MSTKGHHHVGSLGHMPSQKLTVHLFNYMCDVIFELSSHYPDPDSLIHLSRLTKPRLLYT